MNLPVRRNWVTFPGPMGQSIDSSLLATLLRAFGRGLARALQIEPVSPPGAPAPRRPRPPAPAPRQPAPPPPPPPTPVRPKSGHEIVRYRQGRGSFEARIVGFDKVTKMITLERLSDGKRVQRPASKVYSGA